MIRKLPREQWTALIENAPQHAARRGGKRQLMNGHLSPQAVELAADQHLLSAVRLQAVVKHVERVADHVTNLCETV